MSVDGPGLQVAMQAVDPGSGERTPYPSIPLRPLGDDRFIVIAGESQDGRIEFIPGADGRPRFMRLGGRFADRIEE